MKYGSSLCYQIRGGTARTGQEPKIVSGRAMKNVCEFQIKTSRCLICGLANIKMFDLWPTSNCDLFSS